MTVTLNQNSQLPVKDYHNDTLPNRERQILINLKHRLFSDIFSGLIWVLNKMSLLFS